MFAIIAAAGLPHVDYSREDINTTIQTWVSDMRFARARSITSGTHYAVSWSGSSYDVERLVQNGSSWQLDSVVKSYTLPDHVTIAFDTSAGNRIEFNTRGMMISSNMPVWAVVSDSVHGATRLLSIWPSGQIAFEG